MTWPAGANHSITLPARAAAVLAVWGFAIALDATGFNGGPVASAAPPAEQAVPRQAQATAAESERMRIEQKLSLLETYLDSASVRQIDEGNSADAKAMVAESRRLMAEARQALASGRYLEANRVVTDALRSISSASRLVARTGSGETPQEARENFVKLRDQIRSYLRVLARDAPAAAEGQEDHALAQIESLTREAVSLAEAGDYAEANELIAAAYRSAVLVVADRRDGQTVTARLVFETPMAELDYERQRNESYEMLVELMVGAQPDLAVSLRPLADRSIGKSRALKRQAEAQAADGEVDAAIKTMENATRELIRALQASGLPIPQ